MEVNLHSQDGFRGTRFMLVSVAAGEAPEVLTQFSLLTVSPTPTPVITGQEVATGRQ